MPSLAMARHDPTTALLCAATPQRSRDVVAKPLGHFLEHPPDARHTHWHSHTRTATLSPSPTESGIHTSSGGRPTRGSRLSGEARGATPWAHVVSERKREIGVSRGWPVRPSQPACLSSPGRRPAEPQAKLTHGAKLTLLSPESSRTPFLFLYPA
jgi:hypothetical protein